MKSLLYWSQGLINELLGILRFSCSGKVWHMLCANRSPRPKRRVIYHSTTQQVVTMLIEAWTPKTFSLYFTWYLLPNLIFYYLPSLHAFPIQKFSQFHPCSHIALLISGEDVTNCEIGCSGPARPPWHPPRGRLRSLQLSHGSGMMGLYAV